MRKIEVVGPGRQGVVLAGQILGRAAAYGGKNVVQTQSYGAEARGTAANSEIIILDGEIGFPMVRKSDVAVAMSQEAVDKNLDSLKKDGVILLDGTMVTNIPATKAKIYAIPDTEIAEKAFGQKLYANMIILGALTKIINIVDEKSMEKAVEDTVPKKALTVNLQAYKKGMELIG